MTEIPKWQLSITVRHLPVQIEPRDSRDTCVNELSPPVCQLLFALIFNLKREWLGEGRPHSCLYLTCFHHDGYLTLSR